MEINLKTDIEWINEDGSIDEVISSTIQKAVIDVVVKKVESSLCERVMKKADEIIDEKLKTLTEEFMSKGFNVYDNWGDIKQVNVNVKDLLKEKLDKYLIEKVDSNFKTTTYNGKPRYSVVLEKTAEKSINDFMGKISKTVVEGIKNDINAEARERITNSILSDYKLKDIIKTV